jgi:hypothetical protein
MKQNCWECIHHSGNSLGCWCELDNIKLCEPSVGGMMKAVKGHKFACDKFICWDRDKLKEDLE